MAEREEELKSLLMKVKEESEKVGFKTQHSETKIMASGTITSWQIDGKTMETVRDFILGGVQKQTAKHLPTMRETQIQPVGGEDLLEKEMATHSSILAWRIPQTEEPGGLQSMGSKRVGHDQSDLAMAI